LGDSNKDLTKCNIIVIIPLGGIPLILKAGEEMQNITIYTTPSCIWCKRAKSYLNENKISFEEKDVSVDREAAYAMINKSGQRGVPVLDINGTIIIGFDQVNIDKLLGL